VDARIAIELDGFAQHRTGATFRDDRRRQNALILEGWLLLRFTWDDVTRNGEIVIDTLRRALAERKGQPANGED
jgi:very-short-patch-repair endonuclease